MTIMSWIIFGLITGVIANFVDPQESQGGMAGAIVLGILGAFLGSLLGNLILGTQVTGFNLSSFAIAVVGSLFLLGLPRLISRV